ncbi:MAG: GspH/FimT family pseudopilin [Nitrosomonadales bacterium]|nr:GspH/FimT family pseudopilin [Nitrosomonadales bacterium]
MLTHRQSGFSLVELMIAITIVGLLLTAGVSVFGRWTQNQQIRVAAESILNGMQLARAEAVKRNGGVQFVLGTQSAWTVTENGGGTQLQARSEQEGSRNATVTVTPNGATTLTFNSLGRVTANTGGSASITQIDITNALGDRPLRITINLGGTLRMCDPSPSLPAGDPRAC